jgi:hypothetical protein
MARAEEGRGRGAPSREEGKASGRITVLGGGLVERPVYISCLCLLCQGAVHHDDACLSPLLPPPSPKPDHWPYIAIEKDAVCGLNIEPLPVDYNRPGDPGYSYGMHDLKNYRLKLKGTDCSAL